MGIDSGRPVSAARASLPDVYDFSGRVHLGDATFNAVFDTGATRCVMSAACARASGLLLLPLRDDEYVRIRLADGSSCIACAIVMVPRLTFVRPNGRHKSADNVDVLVCDAFGDEVLIGNDAQRLMGIDLAFELDSLLDPPVDDSVPADDTTVRRVSTQSEFDFETANSFDNVGFDFDFSDDSADDRRESVFQSLRTGFSRAREQGLPEEAARELESMITDEFPDIWRVVLQPDSPADMIEMESIVDEEALYSKWLPPRRYDPDDAVFMDYITDKLQRMGFIKRVNWSHWASPSYPVTRSV